MTVPADPRTSPRSKPVRLVGLTGGIASGKSTVARRLVALGAALIDADALAREVVEPGQPALAEIAAGFGPGVLARDGSLDRTALGAVVFADRAARERLETITHPRIAQLTAARIAAALAGAAPAVVVDIPLLFEKSRAGAFEGVLVVWCDAATQLRRLMTRDGLDETQARARLDAQMSLDEKRRQATWVIDNSGSEQACLEQVDAWWRKHVHAGPQRGSDASLAASPS
ncbi:MAG TPA: dephospho-CoA kinase [Candidatus Dormibacteraeota bacterium]